ncbi:hypothetical protein JAAARDRAFT_206850 [Jaapia argillacea MUCL 33604]|uniref:Uncharacterized protein n=1 Tax=Jaapia argillacea MUCL 33604 TaxID=933084 RepID=A0A067PTL0_9AGAM|nr:hypothetical protein JAAARDRAFT_206850 [Jaapia argillacea MUCL 33604]
MCLQHSTNDSELFTEKYWTHQPNSTGFSPQCIAELAQIPPNHLQCRLFHIRHGNVGRKQPITPKASFSSPELASSLSSDATSSTSSTDSGSGSERTNSGRVDYTQSRLFRMRYGKPVSKQVDLSENYTPAKVGPQLAMRVSTALIDKEGPQVVEASFGSFPTIPVADQGPTYVDPFIRHPRPLRIFKPSWVDEFFKSVDVNLAQSWEGFRPYQWVNNPAFSPFAKNYDGEGEGEEQVTSEEEQSLGPIPCESESRVWQFDLFVEGDECEERCDWPRHPSVYRSRSTNLAMRNEVIGINPRYCYLRILSRTEARPQRSELDGFLVVRW